MEEKREERDGAAGARRLIHIPIIHTLEDMGNLSEAVQRATASRLGAKAWRQKLRAIDQRWSEIERVVERSGLSFDKVRLYQDGLPVCGREREIVEELAGKGSRNHRLLVRLIEKGAILMGTESSELLREEYENIRQSLSPPGRRPVSKAGTLGTGEAETLLKRRDRFIAARINATLRGGETGILFLGMLHSLQGLLDEDIRVTMPALDAPGGKGTE
jgi:hypothetical protein